MIRWIETLVERADGAFAERRVQNVWSADREAVPEGHPLAPEAAPGEWPSRTLNCILAVLALLALLPVMVLVAVLIKLTSRGPIFYLQERVGLDRRLPGPGPYNHRRGPRAPSGPSRRTPASPRWAGSCASTGWTSCPSSSTCSRAT